MVRIADAFTSALAAFAAGKGLPVGWVNTSFVPPLTPHLRPVLRAEPPKAASLGPGAYIRHSGVCAVDIVVPAGNGEAEALGLAESLLASFRRGMDLGLDGLKLLPGWSAPGAIKDGRYTIAVSLPYYAYLQEN